MLSYIHWVSFLFCKLAQYLTDTHTQLPGPQKSMIAFQQRNSPEGMDEDLQTWRAYLLQSWHALQTSQEWTVNPSDAALARRWLLRLPFSNSDLFGPVWNSVGRRQINIGRMAPVKKIEPPNTCVHITKKCTRKFFRWKEIKDIGW